MGNAWDKPLKSLAFLKLTALKQTAPSVIDIHKHPPPQPPPHHIAQPIRWGLGGVGVEGSNEWKQEGKVFMVSIVMCFDQGCQC